MTAKTKNMETLNRRFALRTLTALMLPAFGGCASTSSDERNGRSPAVSITPPSTDVDQFSNQFSRHVRLYMPPFRGTVTTLVSVGNGQVSSPRISHGYGLGDVSALLTRRLAEISPAVGVIREAELSAINEGALRIVKQDKKGAGDAPQDEPNVLIPHLHFQLTILEYLPESNVQERTQNIAAFGARSDGSASRSSSDGKGSITFTLEATGPDRVVRQHMALACKCTFDSRSLAGKNVSVSIGPVAGGVSQSTRNFYGFTDAVDYTLTHMMSTLFGRYVGMPVESYWSTMGRQTTECEWAQTYISRTRAMAANRALYYTEVAFHRAMVNGGHWPRQYEDSNPPMAFKPDTQGGTWSWTGPDGVVRRVPEHPSVAELRRAGYLMNQNELELVVLRAQLHRALPPTWLASWTKLGEVRQELARAAQSAQKPSIEDPKKPPQNSRSQTQQGSKAQAQKK